MRKQLFNHDWQFIREDADLEAVGTMTGEPVTLPHTWNGQDGQDGDGKYYRGRCWYTKRFARPELEDGSEVWLELQGAAMTAEVYLNGQKLARHEGGYSTFRANLTPALTEKENLLAVSVDNGENRTVYPQKADFTFYGGIYRNVFLITVPAAHFALDYHGGPGIKVTASVPEDLCSAEVTVETWQNTDRPVTITVDGQRQTVPSQDGHAQAVFAIKAPRLWDGVNDPYLYETVAELESGDKVSTKFGCRRFSIDSQKGFFLNGRSYRLCGAARHQDRPGIGSALTPDDHEQDAALLLEMGANTVRLAHYQHDQYFYDLCDRHGLTVWAEIPYISEHMPEGNGNTAAQMTDLIVQSYNHPSIICWCLSNEITAAGGMSEDLLANHKSLNELCHRLDATRPTTVACVNMLDPDDPLVKVTDIRSFNHYYGWYMGELRQMGEWCDDFHARHPELAIGISECGADANPAFQSARPERGDWSEGYQAMYHEGILKMWSERPYLWALHCWNMFDFAADSRDGGGKPGQNQKGLVNFDRSIQKDAFYIYKAYLSKTPFVHLCGRRYVDRTESEIEIKVYSNLPNITLFVDGEKAAEQSGDKVFVFKIPITGKHTVTAAGGECRDEIFIRKVDKPNPTYIMEGGTGEVVDWFDCDSEMIREGYFSIKDSMADVKAHPEAGPVFGRMIAPIQQKVMASFGGDAARMVKIPESARAMMDQASVEATLKQMGKLVPKSFLRELNTALNQIKK